MKTILILSLFSLTSCSTTIVYAPKHNYNISQHGSSIEAQQENQGSDLKDNEASQDSAGTLSLPIP